MNSHERRALTRKKLYETREAVGPHNRPKQDSNKPNIMTVPNPPPPPPKNPDPNGSKDNTPRWAKFTQIGALLVAIGLLFATLIQSCATQKAAETADGTLREMKTTSQPWVGLENNLISIDGPPSWGDTPYRGTIMFDAPQVIPPHSFKDIRYMPLFVNLSYSIKNYGPLPALRENEIIKATPDTFPNLQIPSPSAGMDMACQYAEQLTTGKNIIDHTSAEPEGGIILPGASVPKTQFANIILPEGVTQLGHIWFFVCTVYVDPRGDRVHHLRYWFHSIMDNTSTPLPIPNHPSLTYIPLRGVELRKADED